ncbi:MAG TPA: DUF202 domain-containing protein [Gammaproteobacteria bacterium]
MTKSTITQNGSARDPSVELASRRTGMSFQRTRMAADRTLMAVIRTSLALISFGFTIAEAFHKLQEANVLTRSESAMNFGLALVALGIAVLAIGIVYHIRFMLGLRAERESMMTVGLIHGESRFPASQTLIAALLLLLIGVAAIISMLIRFTPPFA